MSEPVSNKDKKSKSKGPLLRVETAGDIPEDKLKVMTAKFAEVNEIADYRLSIEVKPELIGGFIIYFHGNRYDYSVGGQLGRINNFMKRTRAINSLDKTGSTEFSKEEVRRDLEAALSKFTETPASSIDSAEVWNLNEDDFNKRVEESFKVNDLVDEVGTVSAISDGVAQVSGLRHCMLSELISFSSGATGIAMNLEVKIPSVRECPVREQ